MNVNGIFYTFSSTLTKNFSFKTYFIAKLKNSSTRAIRLITRVSIFLNTRNITRVIKTRVSTLLVTLNFYCLRQADGEPLHIWSQPKIVFCLSQVRTHIRIQEMQKFLIFLKKYQSYSKKTKNGSILANFRRKLKLSLY